MTTPQRPEGYRAPTREERKKLPKGTLVKMSWGWDASLCIGEKGIAKNTYAVPIADPSAVPRVDPLSLQVGGDHYKSLKIQPAEFITSNGLGFLEGCVIKRVCRHGSKNKAEDIRKAIHELKLILKLQYNENE